MRNIITTTIACGFAIGFAACSSSKVLTESSARNLVRDGIKRANSHFMASVAELGPAMQRTDKDYTATASTSGPEFIVKRLVAKHFVIQKPVVIGYPVISGTYATSAPYGFRGFVAQITFDLRTDPNSNLIKGTYREKGPDMENSYRIEGLIQPDGSAQLRTQPGESYAGFGMLHYQEDGSGGRITYSNRQYVGPASGKKFEKTFYDYAFSDDLRKQLSDVPGVPLQGDCFRCLPAGDFVIGDVTDLQLVLETHAAVNVAWSVSPTELGAILLGDGKPTGKTEVHFVKKPDGTWVLDMKDQ